MNADKISPQFHDEQPDPHRPLDYPGDGQPDPYQLLERLNDGQILSHADFVCLLQYGESADVRARAASLAKEKSLQFFDKNIYVRGLIEFSNFCHNNCYYCGIRCDNQNVERYRLTEEEILKCCKSGYSLGYRTFVLQSGEDFSYDMQSVAHLIRRIKENHPDCAVTLSLGERSFEEYRAWFEAGADRYLLRHETADEDHYRSLHPESMSYTNRMNCLKRLKEIGYQVGCGFMVGTPGQTAKHLASDLIFIRDFKPEMVGIGPFVPASNTPFEKEVAGSVELTLYLISLIRLILPAGLIPATTALGTLDPLGREKGIQAGANVLMPNLSPVEVREKYKLYDNKICTGEEAAECRDCLSARMNRIGYTILTDRGDAPGFR